MPLRDQTIFALSSGRPPSAIAIVRVSGPQASAALKVLAGKTPAPRMATVRASVPAETIILDGQKFKLSDYRGKVVVLDFWGHW